MVQPQMTHHQMTQHHMTNRPLAPPYNLFQTIHHKFRIPIPEIEESWTKAATLSQERFGDKGWLYLMPLFKAVLHLKHEVTIPSPSRQASSR